MNRESTRVRILAAAVITLALLSLAGATAFLLYRYSAVQSGYEVTARGGPGVTVVVVEAPSDPDPTKAVATWEAMAEETTQAKLTVWALTRTATARRFATLIPSPASTVSE